MSEDGSKESTWRRIFIPVAIAVLIALIVGTSSPWWVKLLFPDPTSAPGATIVVPPGATPNPGPQTVGPGGGGPTVAPGGDLANCTLKVTYAFAEMHAGPNFDVERTGDVPEGDHRAAQSALTEWAGRDFRWYLVTVDGRSGWIADDGIQIESKSSGCP